MEEFAYALTIIDNDKPPKRLGIPESLDWLRTLWADPSSSEQSRWPFSLFSSSPATTTSLLPTLPSPEAAGSSIVARSLVKAASQAAERAAAAAEEASLRAAGNPSQKVRGSKSGKDKRESSKEKSERARANSATKAKAAVAAAAAAQAAAEASAMAVAAAARTTGATAEPLFGGDDNGPGPLLTELDIFECVGSGGVDGNSMGSGSEL